MASVQRHYDDAKIANAVRDLDADDLRGYNLATTVLFDPPVANGVATGTITVTHTYVLEQDVIEDILKQAH